MGEWCVSLEQIVVDEPRDEFQIVRFGDGAVLFRIAVDDEGFGRDMIPIFRQWKLEDTRTGNCTMKMKHSILKVDEPFVRFRLRDVAVFALGIIVQRHCSGEG